MSIIQTQQRPALQVALLRQPLHKPLLMLLHAIGKNDLAAPLRSDTASGKTTQIQERLRSLWVRKTGRDWMRLRCIAHLRLQRWARHHTEVHLSFEGWRSHVPPLHTTRPKLRITLLRCLRCNQSRRGRRAPRHRLKRSIVPLRHHSLRRLKYLSPLPARWTWTKTMMTAAMRRNGRPRSKRVARTVRSPQTALRPLRRRMAPENSNPDDHMK